VSASKQKEDLKRQKNHLEVYVGKKHWKLVQAYQDIGSGLNDSRKGLLRLIRELPVIQPDYLVCSYSDRLARFGTTIIQTICAIYDTKIIITHEKDLSESLDGQLVKDVIAVITSFAGKLYRRRRGKLT
jgi:predicted site-specific integrase-resolvase